MKLVTDVYLQLRVEEMEVRCRRLERLLHVIEEIDERMRGWYPLEPLLDRIVDLCEQLVGAEAGSILLFDEEQQVLRFVVARGGASIEQLRKVTLRLGEGVAGHVAQTGAPLFVSDVRHDRFWSRKVDLQTGFKTRSLIAVPLQSHGNLLGVLEIVNKPDDRLYTPDDLLVVNILAERAATAIYNTRLRTEREQERRRYEDERRLVAIGQKTADISHYVRGILLLLRSASERIEEGLHNERLDLVTQSWNEMKDNLQRLQTLVSSMLIFSQERIPAYEWCPLNRVVEESLVSVRRLARERQIRITLRLDRNMPPLRIDREGMTQALLNLVINSLQAMKSPGRITITTFLNEQGEHCLIYRDNGPGLDLEEIRRRALARQILPPDQLDRMSPHEIADLVFHPNISTKGNSGTGLGLAITRKIVSEHNGQVLVEPRRGGGVQFTIRLPA